MRTTINVDDRLLAEARRQALEAGTTLTALIEDALRAQLARRGAPERSSDPFRLHTFTGAGLRPGVDLDDSAALRDVLDDRA